MQISAPTEGNARPEKGRMTVRFIAALFMGVLLFIAGIYVGANNRPDIEKLTGVTNVLLPLSGDPATGTPQELTTCTDVRGAEVPCLLDREQVTTKDDTDADFNQFWKAWNVINEKFVPTKKKNPSNQEKVWGAIAGLANSLGDPYTFFMPPQEKSLFEQDVRGAFGGVGMQIGMKDGIVTVIAPLKGSPAERAGIMKGDLVVAIDGATTTDMTIDKALYLIRGDVGLPVTLTLFRNDDESHKEPFAVTIVREEIKVPTIETEEKDGIFIVRLFGFPATGADLFRMALRDLVKTGDKKMILDLRGNPGGYLEVSVDMASWFLPQGKVIVREAEKDGEGETYRSRGYNVFGDEPHIVVLIDGGSASAAEILAGALHDHGVATLVGTKSFGKGSVQELVSITDDTALKVTIARWITPAGVNLSDGGIDPDIEVKITKEDIDAGKDPQLEKAIEIAREKGKLSY